MSRELTNQTNEGIICSPGGLSGTDGGPITVACLWRPLDLDAMGLINVRTSADADIWAVNPYADGLVYYGTSTAFTSSNPTTYNDTTAWRLDVWSKANGNSTARYHWYKYSGTGSGSWNHADKGSVTDGSGTVGNVLIGALNSTETLNGRIGALAVWTSVLSDANIETLEDALQNWMDLGPAALWKFDENDVSSGAVDVTGNGADETSHSGTSFSTDEPSPFDYSLGNELAIGTAVETDTAIAFGRLKSRALGVAAETDSAVALGRAKARTLGVVAETDSAIAFGRMKSRALGTVIDLSEVLPLSRRKSRLLGVATETDTAVAFGAPGSGLPLDVHVGQPRSPWEIGQPRSPWEIGQPRSSWHVGQPR